MANQQFKEQYLRPLICFTFAAFVLVYLIIRAFQTEFISDETATYWYFIYRGSFWGNNVVWDAANHPLNSFLGHHLFNKFGDVPGILRIGSLFSYVLYAYATYRFTGLLNRKSLQILGFIAMNSVPYMLEYFAYSRGYGLSHGFFVCALWYIYQYAQKQKLYAVVLCYLCAFLGFAANLTLLNSVMLIILAVGIIHLTHWKKIKLWQHITVFAGTLFLARICWPLIAFALNLKEKGALYYSSLDGIWDMTGKSISKQVWFTDSDILMFVYLLFFAIVLYQLFLIFRTKKWKEFIAQPETWVNYLFFGNLVAVLLLAIVLKVNYPEDRTGMYFIPLFLLMVLHAMQKLRFSEIALVALPIVFFTKMNLHSSVFTPEERITREFYAKVKAELNPDDAVSLYKTMFANWQYLESHQSKGIHFPHTTMRNGDEADVFITRRGVQALDSLRNPYLYKKYRLFATDPNNDHLAYRRIQPRKENTFFELDTTTLKTEGEYMDLLSRNVFFQKQGDVKVKFDFHMSISEWRQSTDFIVVTMDENGQTVRYLPMALELNFQSKRVNDHLRFSVLLDNLESNEKGIKVYLWSRKPGIKHVISKLHIEASYLQSN